MTRFYDIDEANATLVKIEPLLATLSDQRAELIRLRDRVRTTQSSPGGADAGAPALDDRIDEEEARRIRLRIQGVVDQMAAAVARVDGLGITLRDIEHGLIDFPALAGGRQVWLCWQLGETDVAFWHELESGFGGRRPLIDLV